MRGYGRLRASLYLSRSPPPDKATLTGPRDRGGESPPLFFVGLSTPLFYDMATTQKSSTKSGLSYAQQFCPEGADPFETVQWGFRDASIRNFKGEAIFEQLGVEFPEAWTPLAVNVVASKYFYGDIEAGNGSPTDGKREFSLRQLLHRVSDTVSEWGRTNGYFDGKASARAFYNDLVYQGLHQMGAFNSPVWFNVGLGQVYGLTGGRPLNWYNPETCRSEKVDPMLYPQGSACFILSVDDNLDDIWASFGKSATLFKHGSGVGADWSTLRSTKEKLTGGGTPSGPVSFMKVQDATGGTIKSGGKTRRAAIMQTLRSWHPDILEFVRAKSDEERKAWALIEQGYDGSFNGPAYGSVAFQNVNQSVRADNLFMEAALVGRPYALKAVTTGETIEEVDARALMREIAYGTHVCGDPGMQFEDTIHRWHTCKAAGRINSSNPCSEYLFLDNTACNLASLNLRKFQKPGGALDTDRLQASARCYAIAQEIIVGRAGYPDPEVARLSYLYRTIGLGYANVGAMLMAAGLPYDSEEGRAFAAAAMANIHFSAMRASADVAAVLGPFAEYGPNRESMTDVMDLHVAAATDACNSIPDTAEFDHARFAMSAAVDEANTALNAGKLFGYRNAQFTVLAPTGTIGFMMDCDTTGVEPDIALVKYKLLAGKGDGMMKIVNASVGPALRQLGYSEGERQLIIAYIDTHDTIEDCPVLKDEHLAVFDCAFKPEKGKRSILPEGHLKMMAANQPFVSGAISKTVNLPETATVEDIEQTYFEAWRIGIKAVAVYRENSKRSQPLSTKRDRTEVAAGDLGAARHKPLGDEVPSDRFKIRINGEVAYVHVGFYPDGTLGEVFVRVDKQGTATAGWADAFSKLLSKAIQYGVPLDELVETFRGTRFDPEGYTGPKDKVCRQASSWIDLLFAHLESRFGPGSRGDGGAQVPTANLATAPIENPFDVLDAQLAQAVQVQSTSAERCPRCSSPSMIPNGKCKVCSNCSWQGGCG